MEDGLWPGCSKKRKLEQPAFGQDVQDGNPQEDDAGDAVSDAAAPSNASTAGISAMSHSLPVRFPPNSKVSVCGMCNTRADEPSPLSSASGNDSWCGFVPWNGYKKVGAGSIPDMPAFKKPAGESCLICVNTYTVAGFKVKHGSIASYKKYVLAKNNQSEHSDFLEMRKKWIKVHNEASDAKSVASSMDSPSLSARLRTSLVGEFRTKRVEVVDSQRSIFLAPKKQFVEAEHWDEAKDGMYDTSKETEVVIFGKKRKGIWKQVGRTGVWDASEQEAKEVKDTRVEEEAADEIAEHAAQIKSEKLAESFFFSSSTARIRCGGGPAI